MSGVAWHMGNAWLERGIAVVDAGTAHHGRRGPAGPADQRWSAGPRAGSSPAALTPPAGRGRGAAGRRGLSTGEQAQDGRLQLAEEVPACVLPGRDSPTACES